MGSVKDLQLVLFSQNSGGVASPFRVVSFCEGSLCSVSPIMSTWLEPRGFQVECTCSRVDYMARGLYHGVPHIFPRQADRYQIVPIL